MNRFLRLPPWQSCNVPAILFRLLLFLVLSSPGVSTVYAQDTPVKPPSYPRVNYDPLQPPPPNNFGVLYNSTNYWVQVPTQYYGMQGVWLTAYLPYIESEFDPTQQPVPFGNYYTTGLALRSPRDPAKELWAPIEITVIEEGDPETAIEYPFASIMGIGSPPTVYNGSFNLLSNLNEEGNPQTPNPVFSVYGTSALHIAQQFTRFTHTFLGHDGLDKSGTFPIKIALRNGTLPNLVGGKFVFKAETTDGVSLVSRSTLGYSLANGLVLANLPKELSTASEASTLSAVFGQVVSLAFVNWENPSKKFINPGWTLAVEDVFPQNYPASIPFDNPKSYNLPNAYKGTNWVEGVDASRSNSAVGNYLFYLLNNKKVGYPDDDTSKEIFVTEPLIPGDKHATYELALKLFYDALVPGLNANTTYPEFRKLLLNAAVLNGHPVGSPVYKRIMTACYAAGIGALPYTSNPDCAVTKQAESWFNGPVSFHAREVTLTEDPVSARAFQLIDCTEESFIETVEFDPTNPDGQAWFINTNPLQSNLYGKDQNLLKSKIGVSVHAYSIVARNWFRTMFQHYGMDGKGKIGMVNTVGDPASADDLWGSFNTGYLFFPYTEKSGCRDEIFRRYAIALQLFRDFPFFLDTDMSEDARICVSAVANIFALEIKKDEERAKQNPAAEDIWTLFEEISSSTPMMDFSQPKLYGQPSVYHGANWSATSEKHNAGFLHFFYYLLVHGTEGQNGYTNDEPGSLTYFVNKMPRELALKVLWDASRAISHNASIEEFRQATLTALHSNPQYHPKSKEHISLFDAWAAVLGLPDYASSLAHSPDEDAKVYPWPVKVGVESEYPMYESYRLFEVSESDAFSESEAPVYRFVSNQAPELMNSMTYGQINLEAGHKYFVRSHLVDGPGAREHCAGTDDPHFCESLLNKKKWTMSYPFKTENLPSVMISQPLQATVAPAWATPFSWGSTPGAAGYDIHIIDDISPESGHLIPIDEPYDEDKLVVNTKLALSKQKGYIYKIAAKQKLGSEWAVHVLPNGMIVNFTDEEKSNFLTIYGDWSSSIWFKTDQPTISLLSPTNYSEVPLFGEDVRLMADKLNPNSADYYQLYVKDPLYQALAQDTSAIFTDFTLHIPDLLELNNDKEYSWAIIPKKKPIAPFILKEEEGTVSEWFHFTAKADLAPKPELDDMPCVNAGEGVKFSWKAIQGVKAYQYSIFDPLFQKFIVIDRVEGDTKSPVISNASVYPGPYLRSVRGAVKNSEGVWLLGPVASAFYFISPPSPSNLSPNNVNGVPLGANNSVQLTWTMPPGVTSVRLFAEVEGGSTLIDTEVLGSTFVLENLPFNEDISWFVSSISSGKSCESKEVGAVFHTEGEPVIPELNFNFSLLCFDGFGLPGPVADYNLVIRDPNGDVVFSKIGLKSHFSNPKGILPLANGIYKVDAVITKADPIYLKTPATEGSVSLQTQLWDIGAANQELDSDFQGGFFEPVTNLQFHFLFDVDLTDNSLHHRSSAEKKTKKAVRVYGFEVKYPEIEMTIFPNPASNQAELMPGLYQKDLSHPLQVYDQQGRAVISRDWQGEKLDVSNLPEGMYIVKVKRGELTFTQKLIVKKR